MTDHMYLSILNALADGELSPDQLTSTNQHLVSCPLCTSNALYQSLLKSATAKAGHRYSPPPNLHDRLVHQIRLKVSPRHTSYRGIAFQVRRGFSLYG
jgi:anti-sigma factor RsiW